MNLVIETLKKEDYKKIPLLYQETFDDEPWNEDWYKIKQFDANAVFVAKIDQKMVGFIISFLSEKIPYISVLGVKKECRRKRIAKQLLNTCLAHWDEYDQIMLHVDEKRMDAIHFYQNNGFKQVSQKEEDIKMVLTKSESNIILPQKIKNYVKDLPYEVNNVGLSGSHIRMYSDMVLKIERTQEESNKEYQMMTWLEGRLPVPNILLFEQENGYNYLLMRKIEGLMFYQGDLLTNPKETIALLAEALKTVWSVDVKDCPSNQRLEHKLVQAEYRVNNNLVCTTDFDLELRQICGVKTPRDILDFLKKNKPTEDLNFSHGDFCLPNMFYQNKSITGFIDLGRSGVADLWVDLALCIRSLQYNLQDQFKAEYIDLLLSYLGVTFDQEKFHYYLLLDELF